MKKVNQIIHGNLGGVAVTYGAALQHRAVRRIGDNGG
jgi:hypothetical protein